MKSNRIKQAINKGLLALGVLLMLSTLALAQNGNGNGNKKNNEEESAESLQVTPLAAPAAAAAAPGGGGGGPTQPAAPNSTISVQAYNCGSTRLTRSSGPATGIWWSWNTTYYTPGSSSGAVGITASTYDATTTGMVYLQAYNFYDGIWGGYISFNVTQVNSTPAIPSMATVQNNCGNSVVSYTSGQASGQNWHWQTSASGTATDPVSSTLSKTFTSGSTIYVRAKSAQGCWSSARTVGYAIKSVPTTPLGPTTNAANCTNAVVGYDAVIANGRNWHWQTSTSGTVTDPVDQTLSKTFYSTGTIYVRAKNAQGCWSDARQINYNISVAPNVPAVAAVQSNCGNAVVSYASVQASGQNWHWQTSASGTATDLVDNSLSKTFYSNGTIYVRAKSAQGCWSAARQINYTIHNVPGVPAVASVQNNCGESVVSYTSAQASGQNWHWQTSASGTATDPVTSTLSKTFTFGSTIYVRAKTGNGCWSTARTVSYSINSIPNTPFDPTTNDSNCGSAFVEYDPIIANGKNWHWQNTDTGTATDLVDNTPSRTFYADGSIFVRAKSTQGCWSTAKQIDYLINPIPDLAIGSDSSRCGDGSITLVATPQGSGDNIKWYTTSSGGTAEHTGTSLLISNLTADVTYYAASYNSTTFCEDADRVAITADWKAEPAPFTAGGGAAVCPGDAISVTLSGSESGTTYTLYRETTSTGQSKNGTGGAISFDNQTFSGTYTIKADRNGCPATMPGSAVLSHLIVPTPDIPTVGNERCGPKTVTKVGNPPQLGPNGEPVYWYWMGTDPDNPNPTAFGATQSVGQTGTYFIRAQEGFLGQGGCWSAPIMINVTIDYPLGFPIDPEVGDILVTANTCDAKTASTTQTLPAGQDFYWQGLNNAATAINTDPGSTSDLMATGGKYYMRTSTDEGCFSDPVSFDVDGITIRPLVKTIAGPTTNQYADTPADYRKIRIDNSESHVEYRVQKNGINIGNDFHGSGTTARSSLIMEDGDYTVIASRNGCETEMGQTITIGSDTNENSGTSRSYTVPETVPANLPTILGEVLTSTSYADGMGRPLQSVVKQVSPDQKDMVSFYEYDDLGRMNKQYLPYVGGVDGTMKSDPKTAQTAFYQAAGDHIANDTRPFSETIYETSPTSRLKKQFGVGQAWYDADNGEGRKASASYETNVITDPAVIHWQVVNDELVNSGTYAVGQLYKTTGTNEENHQVMTFTNKVGQTVLKKVKSGVDTWAETYNVYDKQGRLRFVIPPLALEEYNAPGFGDPAPPYGFYLVETTTNFADIEVASEGKIAYTPGTVIHVNQGDILEKGDIIQSYDPADQVGQPADFHLSDLIFQYRYDHRHRLIEKRVPGADWVYMVYDDRNRVVLTQDGNQRADSKWSFVKYDQLNRSILTGEKVISGTTAAIRTAVASATVFYETYDAAGLMNYTNLAYPAGITADDIYSVSYYDNYDFTSQIFSPLPLLVFDDLSGHKETPAQTTHALKGLATGAKTKVLGTTTFLETVNFYDDKYRVVQSISENHKGGRDITTVQYNFAGQVMKTYVDHNPDGAANNSTTIAQVYTYDHVGRSLTTTHSIDNATPVTIASYTYNELGALENKTLADGFEDIDYEYNIRGWITQMNNPNDAEDHLFEMEFKYENATDQVNKQYNGNIGEVAWKNPYESTTSSFDYTYDEMNRLKTADYDNTGTSARDYGLENISYDANGNIKTLKRKGDHNDMANQSFDDLIYEYDGNQLMQVTDGSGASTGFNDGADDALEYSYDANGNLIADKNKGITTIAYNHINQPTKVTYDAGKYIEYDYTASGAKVSQKVVENGQTIVTDYLGGFLYQDDKLQIIAHSQGRIVPVIASGSEAISGYEYQYHLTDHLGNVRVTFKTEIDTDIYEASMEDADTVAIKTYFEKYDEVTRIKADLFNHTDEPADYSIWLDGSANRKIGLAKSLMVKPGDVIDMEVWAKYYDNSNSASWTALLNTLASEIASGAVGTVYDAAIGATGLPFVDFLSGNRTTNAEPDAYLNYFVFDSNYELISSKTGFQKVTSAAEEDGNNTNGHEKLSHSLTIDEPGYVYIYLSNEESTPIDVFFDDFKVTQTHSPVVQKSDYQAFGLEFNSYSRAAITTQNFKFNAGSEQEQMTDWYSTPFRKYDPSLGRFHGVDALADLYTSMTPSHFGMNNPINYNDPTGLTVAPKSENQKQGAGGGTQHRHLPDGLGPNYARAGWTSLYANGWASTFWSWTGAVGLERNARMMSTRQFRSFYNVTNANRYSYAMGAAKNVYRASRPSNAAKAGLAKLKRDFKANAVKANIGVLTPQLAVMPDLGPASVGFYLEFVAGQSAGRQRVDGVISIIEIFSDGTTLARQSFSAVSGSRSLDPIPTENMKVTNHRERDDKGFTKDGVGFSFDVGPEGTWGRFYLRIHPDGGLNGTAGCIGLNCSAGEMRVFESFVRNYIEDNSFMYLKIFHNNPPGLNNGQINGTQQGNFNGEL